MMRWFRENKSVESTPEIAEDAPATPEIEPVCNVYVAVDGEGKQYLMTTEMVSPSLTCLYSGRRDICEAFVEGHQLGFGNAVSRTDLLLGIVKTEYLHAYKTMRGLSEGSIPPQDLRLHVAVFEELQCETMDGNRNRYMGIEISHDVDEEIENRSSSTAEVIDLMSYREFDDGAA